MNLGCIIKELRLKRTQTVEKVQGHDGTVSCYFSWFPRERVAGFDNARFRSYS